MRFSDSRNSWNRVAPPPTLAQRQSIDQILQAGWYLLELINEILDLALIESGKLSLSPEPISLADVLSDCRGMIEPLALKNGIGLTFPRFDGHAFRQRRTEPAFKQVLINLLSNAIKYNRAGGTVEVICTMSATQRTAYRRARYRQWIDAGKARPAVPAVQSPRTGVRKRGGDGHRLGGEQAIDRIDGRRNRRRKHDRRGQRVLDRTARDAAPRLVAVATEVTGRTRRTCAHSDAALHTLLCVEDNPANLMLVEKLLERRSDIRLLVGEGRYPWHRNGACCAARCHSDGHQPARHQRTHRPRYPGGGSGNGEHSGDRPERQRHAGRHRERTGSRLLPLSHQADQSQRVHGHAG